MSSEKIDYYMQTLSGAQLANMRDWLKELTFANAEAEDIDAANDRAVVRNVEKFYDGGVMGFLRDY